MKSKEILEKINHKNFINNHKLYRETIDDLMYTELEFYRKLFKTRGLTTNSAEGILKELLQKWKKIIKCCNYFDENCFNYLLEKFFKLVEEVLCFFRGYLGATSFFTHLVDIKNDIYEIVYDKMRSYESLL